MMPPFGLVLPGFAWRFTMLIFSKKTRPASRSTLRTLPTFPFSLPTMTRTMSFFRIWSVASAISPSPSSLQNFRSQGYDLHEFPGAEVAGHRSEDPRSDRLPLRIDEHGRILVEPEKASVGPAAFLGGPPHHRLVHTPLPALY